MNKKFVRSALLILSSFIFLGGVSHAAGETKSFKADIKITAKATPQTAEARLFVDGPKVLVETPQQTLILRADLGTMYVLIPATKTYYEGPISFDNLAQYAPDSLDSGKRELVGSDSCGGAACDKMKVALVDGYEKDHPIYQWVLKDGRIAKREAVDGSWTHHYSNFEAGPQPAVLFEVRKDYRKAS